MGSQSGPPVALSVAGSDNSSGAGIQADSRVFVAHGCYPLTAVTCVVAEIPDKVSAISAVPPGVVAEQLRLCLEAFPVGALKTGMLFSKSILSAVVGVLSEEFGRKKIPLVVDPVMVASSGDALLRPDAVRAYQQLLFPLAQLLTPNADELRVLAGCGIRNLRELGEAGRRLAETSGVPVLAKGGHLRGKEAVDLLLFPGGAMESFSAPFFRNAGTHGTGCAFSAAITANLARGLGLVESVGRAKEFLTESLRERLQWKKTFVLNLSAAHVTSFKKKTKTGRASAR